MALDFAAARAGGRQIALAKSTSNLFRRRERAGTARIAVSGFRHVLSIDPEHQTAEVEGMTTYETFVEATLRYGLLPAVVPQLKTITTGGAVSGVGIESSSFRVGLVHETVEEMEILTAGGAVVRCSRSENPDLFFGFPNSYGTLGYALRLRMKLIPAKPFVHLVHTGFHNPSRFFERIAQRCADQSPDYLDGTVFHRNEMYLTEGAFVDTAPRISDYTYRDIYYRSIPNRAQDWLTAKDYIWRWDTDWFWCSKQFGVQNPVVRALATRWLLNSRTYQRIMRASWRLLPGAGKTESVIQDVDIPIANAGSFLDFLLSEIGILPVWICPFRVREHFPLYALNPSAPYINFGFWDTIPTNHEPGWFNRKVEAKALELGGMKGLYSTAWYDEETFWRIHDKPSYQRLKARYDPSGAFPGLYEKCVRCR